MSCTVAPRPADIILQQLGGAGVLQAMLSAAVFSDGPRALVVRLKAKGLANYVRIALEDDDTYRVVASNIRGLKVTAKGDVGGLSADQLKSTCESLTGLRWSL